MAEVTTPIITDTTGQSIASAISGLGQALGADKANIDGSNIVDASAFRQNIGLNRTTSYTRANNTGFRLDKVGEVVLISGLGIKTNEVGSVPSGYRPSADRIIQAIIADANLHFYFGWFSITSGGSISVAYLPSYGGASSNISSSAYTVYVSGAYTI